MRKKEHPTYGRQKSKRECQNSATPWLFLIVIVVIIIFILIPFFRGRMTSNGANPAKKGIASVSKERNSVMVNTLNGPGRRKNSSGKHSPKGRKAKMHPYR